MLNEPYKWLKIKMLLIMIMYDYGTTVLQFRSVRTELQCAMLSTLGTRASPPATPSLARTRASTKHDP